MKSDLSWLPCREDQSCASICRSDMIRWPTDLSEPEIVSRLFDMYAKLTTGDDSGKVKKS